MSSATNKILAIDDDAELLAVLQAIVQQCLPNVEMISASDGIQGMEIARTEDLDLILLDLVIPGPSGFSVCRRLKADERTRDVPVVFMTAHGTDRRNRVTAQESGAEGFLTKPFEESELLVMIATMVKLRSATRRQRSEEERLRTLVEQRTAELEQELAQRRQVEASLRQSEERFRLLVEKSRDILYTLNTVGEIRYLSPAITSVLGYRPEDLIGTNFREIVHPDDQLLVSDVLRRSFTEGFRSAGTEFRIRHASGDWRWVVARGEASFNLADGGPTFSGLANDITERRIAEEALRTSEERLRLALFAANQGIYDLHVPSGETTVSPEYAAMLGYDPATFRETNDDWIERLHPEDRASAVDTYRRYVAGELADYRVEFRQRTADGSWKWILSVGRVVERDAHGAPIRMLGSHTDIHEMKLMEQRLRETAHQLRALTRRLQDVREDERRELALEIHDGLGHELTAVRMDIGLLERTLATTPASNSDAFRSQMALLKEMVDRAVVTSRHLTARLRPETLDRLGFGLALEWLADQWTIRTHIPCGVTIDPELQAIGDPLAITLYRMTQEGLTNIAKHARATGAIVRFERRSDELLFEIADNGVGLAADAMSGRSYGLLGMRERVESLGGSLVLAANEGGGTILRATWPPTAFESRNDEGAPSPSQRSPAAPWANRAKHAS